MHVRVRACFWLEEAPRRACLTFVDLLSLQRPLHPASPHLGHTLDNAHRRVPAASLEHGRLEAINSLPVTCSTSMFMTQTHTALQDRRRPWFRSLVASAAPQKLNRLLHFCSQRPSLVSFSKTRIFISSLADNNQRPHVIVETCSSRSGARSRNAVDSHKQAKYNQHCRLLLQLAVPHH